MSSRISTGVEPSHKILSSLAFPRVSGCTGARLVCSLCNDYLQVALLGHCAHLCGVLVVNSVPLANAAAVFLAAQQCPESTHALLLWILHVQAAEVVARPASHATAQT
jgi:hypothetical protein